MKEVLELDQKLTLTRQALDHKNEARFSVQAKPGITEETVRQISALKNEPKWMLDKRLKALNYYLNEPLPVWGPDISKLELDKIIYYRHSGAQETNDWENVPADIRKTYEMLGIPEAEKKSLSGVGAQYESSVVYHNLKEKWEKQGVIFDNCDVALKKYPELFEKYFMTNCVPINDHKFASLHAAVWSGGTFIYIPEGVKIPFDEPMQAYFRMNAEQGGQFEHTLIIAEKNAEVAYIEGCSAPRYGSSSLHAGCVELYAGENAKIQYASFENWSKNTYNLNTKRAIVGKNGMVKWLGGNVGSGVTMLYPCSILKGEGSKAEHISVAYAGKGQNQDTGGKVYHLAKNTSSTIISKSISKDSGITSYRGLVKINKGAEHSKSFVKCDALMLDSNSVSNTFPNVSVNEEKVSIGHEATVGKISDDQIFYLMSRGLSEKDAQQLVVNGFMEPLLKGLQLEYAYEFMRLVQLELENTVG